MSNPEGLRNYFSDHYFSDLVHAKLNDGSLMLEASQPRR